MSGRTTLLYAFQAEATSDRANSFAPGYIDIEQNSSQSAVTTGGSHAINGSSVTTLVHSNRVIGCYGALTVTNSGSACRYTVEILEGATPLTLGGRIGDVTSPGSGDIALITGWGFQLVGGAQTNTYSLQITIQSGSGYSLAISTSNPAGGTLAVFDMGGSVEVS